MMKGGIQSSLISLYVINLVEVVVDFQQLIWKRQLVLKFLVFYIIVNLVCNWIEIFLGDLEDSLFGYIVYYIFFYF